MVKRNKNIVLGGGCLLVAFSIPFLFSWFIASSVIIPYTIPNTSATESTDKNTSTSTTDKGYSLSISVPKSVTIDLTPTPSGSFSYSELNTLVSTTNPTGYSLSFNASDSTGNTNANELINTNTNITTNNTIPSITNDTNQSNFPTNSWGYSINDGNNEVANLTFKPIPLPSSSTSDKQLKVTNSADNSTTPTANTNTKLIIGLKANNDLSSGSYIGQLTFTSVANSLPKYNLAYNKNDTTYNPATSVSGTMNTADDLEKYNTYTLASNNYTRPGYRFLGWSTTSSATTATYTNAQSLTEAQVNTLTGNAATGSTITLYAIWQPQNQLTTITQMQQMTANICNNTYTPTKDTTTMNANQYFSANNVPEKILTDTRDNKTYVVRKLADGRCWMAQNLRLGGSSAITLTPANTNITSNFTLSASSNSFGTTDNAAGININRMHNNGNTWLNGSSVQTTGTPPSQTQYMGNYYNWYTATAGTGTYAMSTDGQNATSSICPKGWRLPKGSFINANTGNGELQKLYSITYGNYNSFISVTSAVISGGWSNSSAYAQGSNGIWWSSTVANATDGYVLFLSSSTVSSRSYFSKRSGYSVRCIAE